MPQLRAMFPDETGWDEYIRMSNASMDAVTFTDTYPMQTGQITFRADGREVGSGSKVIVPLDADAVTVTVSAAYVWHTEVGSALYTVQVISPAAPQSLLTGLSIVPCLNNTLDPPFAPATYIYAATEVSPFTSEVAVVATHGSGVTGVTVQVGGKTVDAAHVPLNNATDGTKF